MDGIFDVGEFDANLSIKFIFNENQIKISLLFMKTDIYIRKCPFGSFLSTAVCHSNLYIKLKQIMFDIFSRKSSSF